MIRGTTRIAAVIGHPVEHSRSPQMMNAAFAAAGVDAVLVPLDVAPVDLAVALATLRAAGALGASITIPHKLAVLPLCAQLSPAARAIGAVNCVQVVGGELVGHNTDCEGFVDGLREAGAGEPRRVVLLGGGGAARAVAYGLRAAEALTVIAREPDKLDWARSDSGVTVKPWTDASLREAFARADLVVDCTPIGLGKQDATSEATLVDQLPVGALRDGAWVSTLVYHRSTVLLERARARGHSVVDGRAMLVHQGARAFTIWTGATAPVETMRRALDDALRSPPGT